MRTANCAIFFSNLYRNTVATEVAKCLFKVIEAFSHFCCRRHCTKQSWVSTFLLQNSATCNATFSSIEKQVAEKVAHWASSNLEKRQHEKNGKLWSWRETCTVEGMCRLLQQTGRDGENLSIPDLQKMVFFLNRTYFYPTFCKSCKQSHYRAEPLLNRTVFYFPALFSVERFDFLWNLCYGNNMIAFAHISTYQPLYFLVCSVRWFLSMIVVLYVISYKTLRYKHIRHSFKAESF